MSNYDNEGNLPTSYHALTRLLGESPSKLANIDHAVARRVKELIETDLANLKDESVRQYLELGLRTCDSILNPETPKPVPGPTVITGANIAEVRKANPITKKIYPHKPA